MKITNVTRAPNFADRGSQLILVSLKLADGKPFTGYVVLPAANGASEPLRKPIWFRVPGHREQSSIPAGQVITMEPTIVQAVEAAARDFVARTS